MFGLEGNKSADLDADQRNMRRLVVLEDREFGSSGYINLYWDRHTGLFNEVSEK
jgi:twinkle protein